MVSDRPPGRQPLAVRAAIAILSAIALAGVALMANGLYMKAKADWNTNPANPIKAVSVTAAAAPSPTATLPAAPLEPAPARW